MTTKVSKQVMYSCGHSEGYPAGLFTNWTKENSTDPCPRCALRNKCSSNKSQVGGDHYTKHSVQPWDVFPDWLGHEGFVGNLRGNIFTYLLRYKDKGGVEDLKKARHDLDKLIEVEEGRNQETEGERTAEANRLANQNVPLLSNINWDQRF